LIGKFDVLSGELKTKVDQMMIKFETVANKTSDFVINYNEVFGYLLDEKKQQQVLPYDNAPRNELKSEILA
jgi:hypothetical protein